MMMVVVIVVAKKKEGGRNGRTEKRTSLFDTLLPLVENLIIRWTALDCFSCETRIEC